jgi:photosystem II stability/assembly factor-like uncharacterized protein
MKKNTLALVLCLLSSTLFAQWQRLNGVEPGTIYQIITHNNQLFSATTGGVYQSSDNGQNWVLSSNGITHLYDKCIHSDGSNLWTGTELGTIFMSADNGQTWTLSFQANSPISGITSTSAGIFASREGGHVVHSADNGLTWTIYNGANGLPTSNCYNICSIGDQLFVLASIGIFTSLDDGQTWVSSSNGISSANNLSFLLHYGGELYTCKNATPYVSADNGQNWTSLGGSGIDPNAYGNSFLKTATDLFFGSNYGLYNSTDGGATWSLLSSDYNNFMMESQGMIFYAGLLNNHATLAASSDNGNTWTEYGNGINAMYINTLLATPQNLFSRRAGGMQGSSDQGLTFFDVTGFQGISLSNLYEENASIFATSQITTSNGGLLQAPLSGGVFTPLNGDLTENNVTCFFNTGTSWLLGSTFQGSYRSVNNGVNWVASSGFQGNTVYQFAKAGNTLLAAHHQGIFISNDDGQTWSTTSVGQTVRSIVNSNGVLLAAGLNVIYRSTDNGLTWNNIPITNANIVYKLAVVGNSVLAGTRFTGVRMSQDDGLTWTSVNSGLQDTMMMVQCFTFDQNNLYFGTFGAGIWKRGLNEMNIVIPTLVTSDEAHAIAAYPNPFGHQIYLSGNENKEVLLYDLQGMRVMQQTLKPGEFLSTDQLPKGLYLLEARNNQGVFQRWKMVKE